MEILKNKERTVYTTCDYSIFRVIDGNRSLNLKHLKNLEESIKENYLFTVIVVNEKFEIIDGQHRFNVAKRLNLPLNYVIVNGYGLKEVQILNINSKVWSIGDYLDGYCKLGLSDYVIYKQFMEKYKFNHCETLCLLNGKMGTTGEIWDGFKAGEFKVTNLKLAYEYAERIMQIAPFHNNHKKRAFVYAMLYLFNHKEFNFNEFLEKLKKQPTKLTNCVDRNSYIAVIEEIYNYRRHGSKVNLRYI